MSDEAAIAQQRTIDLAKAYEPKEIEGRRYEFWRGLGYFHAEPDHSKPPYCITIPPPNVTGSLHMGHALNNTILDALTRWHRMRGYCALCLPGTDHAGIATQNVVERQLASEGLTRQQLGREKFVERCWQWREQYGSRIYHQFERLGCSYDWERVRFTMDESYVDAIMEEFRNWYERGLIYRGTRVVNWDVAFQSAVSDIEVEMKPIAGKLYHIRYPFAGASGEVTVATTRPETMLGDTAVAANPEDERYQPLFGKELKLPLTDRTIPMIADEYAKPEFGSGAVKVTPAHDLDDFECGQRHSLPQIVVIGKDGKMTEAAGERYAGLDRFEARKRVVEDLEAQGFLVKIEEYAMQVPISDRSKEIIEPLLSEQWFVDMKPLAQPAIDAVTSGKIRFIPDRYEAIYLHWMNNIRDWCISRQLWWGHRIPVWWAGEGADRRHAFARTREEAEKALGTEDVSQDEDVLDTWFSSALWPHATLGWPHDTEDLRYFYPTNLLSTAQEILYLWVARMVMTGLDFVKRPRAHEGVSLVTLTPQPTVPQAGDGESVLPLATARNERVGDVGAVLAAPSGGEGGLRSVIPFRDVYIHPTVLDDQGRRMSKSLGNGIDPIDLIDKYGADATRFSLMQQAGKNQDIKYSEQRTDIAGNFCNKLWNASRFVLINLDDANTGMVPTDDLRTDVDRWILSRLNATIEAVNGALSTYDMDDAARAIYQFLWNDFCDWYVEMAKPRLRGDDEDRATAQNMLAFVLETTLRLLHPFTPFITEEIWQALPHEGDTIALAPYPEPNNEWHRPEAERAMATTIEATRALRNLRKELGVPDAARVPAAALPANNNVLRTLRDNGPLIATLARLEPFHVVEIAPSEETGKWVGTPIDGGEVFLNIGEALDLNKELERIDKEIAAVQKEIEKAEAKLSNASFVERANPAVVAQERERLASWQEKRARLEERRSLLS